MPAQGNGFHRPEESFDYGAATYKVVKGLSAVSEFSRICCCLVTNLCSIFVTPWTTAHQASLSLTPGVCSNSCPLSRWCHPTISSSVVPFSSCLQSFPASGSLPMNRLFTSGSQSTGASALASVLPMNIQDWLPLELTGLISLQSKELSRVFPSTTVQKHQFSGAQPNLHSPTLTSIHDHRKKHNLD